MSPRGTTLRNFRCDDERWSAFTDACSKEYTDASKQLRDMIDAWLAARRARTIHLLIDTGRASSLAACDEPFANGQAGVEDLAGVTCPACLAMFGVDT